MKLTIPEQKLVLPVRSTSLNSVVITKTNWSRELLHYVKLLNETKISQVKQQVITKQLIQRKSMTFGICAKKG